MSEIEPITETPAVKAPAKVIRHRAKRAKSKAKPKSALRPVKPAEPWAGITVKDCPPACTKTRCCISTVERCAHPLKGAPSGFGPVTLANREQAAKLIKHQMVDLKG